MEQARAWTRLRPVLGRRGRLLGSLTVLTVLVGVSVGVAVRLLSKTSIGPVVITSRHGLDGPASWPAGTRPAPPITRLRDQTGGLFSLGALRGHTLAIVFFDSHCHQECPLEGRALAAAERLLPVRQRPVLVVVSVNPQDTPGSARRAVEAWGLADVAPWHWLMGRRGNLSQAWRDYRVYVASRAVGGDIAHTAAVYLVDRRGYERSAYLYPFAPRFVAHDLRVLAGQKS
jgi:cytochrome oxidase Cu insertion factor (SCO1/SenC/PrrC family)